MSTAEIIEAFENLRHFESSCEVEWGRVQAEADRAIEALKQKIMSTEKDLNYWKENAEEDYKKVPISVLRYITELEIAVKNCSIPNNNQQRELLLAFLKCYNNGEVTEYGINEVDDFLKHNS